MAERTEVIYPLCHVCGWRKGGVDSWDGTRCKCGHYGVPMQRCSRCSFTGRVEAGICPDCDGSGLVIRG